MARAEVEAVIETLGARGDGIAATPDGPLYVPQALPGERVRVRIGAPRGDGHAARLVEIVEPSFERVTPPCDYFGCCGGCAVQHWAEAPYLEWKRGIVAAALQRRGFDAGLVAPAIATPARERRRADLAAIRPRQSGAGVQLGFHAPGSKRIVDIDACAVLVPALEALLMPLRDALVKVLPPGGRCDVLLSDTETGVDMLVTAKSAPQLAQSRALAEFAEAFDLARISWASTRDGMEPVALRRAPQARVGEVAVSLPPGAFQQASAVAETHLVQLVTDAAGDAARIADLYAGIGTFSLPLAQKGARVHAVDGMAEALAALATAAGAHNLGGRITTDARDLAERPLNVPELKDFDAVLFDPPRAGAAMQATQLAQSAVPRIVAVSCNPATFARDAATLQEGGYRLLSVTPVDQFVFTAHVELVAAFEKS